ncbi:hypothetical protein JOM56_012411 [Amanita muscaria]
MPPEVNARGNGPRARAPAAKVQQFNGAPQAPTEMGFGYPYYPQPPPYPYYAMPPPSAPPARPVSLSPVAHDSVDAASATDLEYPLIVDWLAYCDKHARRRGRNLCQYSVTFENEGFATIDQLTGPQITIEKLSEWLGIGRGTADAIIRYAESDTKLLKAGKLTMTSE